MGIFFLLYSLAAIHFLFSEENVDFLIIFGMGVALAMDAFAVSMANGLSEPCMKCRKMLLIAGTFALFQGFMPFIGWLLVHNLAEAFDGFKVFIPWIALGLLSFIGAKMLIDGVDDMKKCDCEKESCPEKLGLSALLVQGIATSIDALSVGLDIYEYSLTEALITAMVIAVVTFVICFGGVIVGKKFGTALAGRSAVFGGIILIAIGIYIFVKSFI